MAQTRPEFLNVLRRYGYEDDFVTTIFPAHAPMNMQQANAYMMYARNVMDTFIDDRTTYFPRTAWRRYGKQYPRSERTVMTAFLVVDYARLYPLWLSIESAFVRRHVLQMAIQLIRGLGRRGLFLGLFASSDRQRSRQQTFHVAVQELRRQYEIADADYQALLHSLPAPGGSFRSRRD